MKKWFRQATNPSIEEFECMKNEEKLPWSEVDESLHNRCCAILDAMPELEYFKWTNMDVLKWITSLGFPQYRNTFYENRINGRTLLLVDANALCRMNIKLFDHILHIAEKIRQLYNVEKILLNRSISLPPRHPGTHFKLYRVYTGPRYQRCLQSEFYRKMQLYGDDPPQRDHWERLTKWLLHGSDRPRTLIGRVKPKLSDGVQISIPPKPEMTDSNLFLEEPCHCVPPCECQWSQSNYKPSQLLTCLAGLQIKDADLKDGDVIVTEEKECHCIPPCECKWTGRELHLPKVLLVVRLMCDRKK